MNISGIIINDKDYKLSQYADDKLFLLDGTSKSLNRLKYKPKCSTDL